MEKAKKIKPGMEKCTFENCKFIGRSDNLKRHIKIHDINKEMHTCDKCGTKASTKGALQRHKRFSCKWEDVNQVEEVVEAPEAVEEVEIPNGAESMAEQDPSTIPNDEFVSLYYLLGRKDGTFETRTGRVQDIPTILSLPVEGN